MWATLGAEMRPRGLDPTRIENAIDVGTADVNYIEGWCELKFVREWPRRGGPLKIRHFTPQQRVWLLRRSHCGGRAFLVLKVATEWYVLPAGEATEILYHGEMTRERAQQWRCMTVGGVVDELSRVS